MSRFNPRTITITNTNNRTYKVKLEYFNGYTWIKDKILIDTGTSQCYYITLSIPVSQAVTPQKIT